MRQSKQVHGRHSNPFGSIFNLAQRVSIREEKPGIRGVCSQRYEPFGLGASQRAPRAALWKDRPPTAIATEESEEPETVTSIRGNGERRSSEDTLEPARPPVAEAGIPLIWSGNCKNAGGEAVVKHKRAL